MKSELHQIHGYMLKRFSIFFSEHNKHCAINQALDHRSYPYETVSNNIEDYNHKISFSFYGSFC